MRDHCFLLMKCESRSPLHGDNDAEGARVDLLTTITNNADDDLLPALPTPGLAAITLAQISDVLHDTVGEEDRGGEPTRGGGN